MNRALSPSFALRFALVLIMGGYLHAGNSASLPNFDTRIQPGSRPPVSEPQREAVARLRLLMPQAKVDFHELIGSPKLVGANSGFLTGPNGTGKAVSPRLAGSLAADPYGPAKAFLQEHRALFGFGAEGLDSARIKREYVTEHNGLKTVVWEQQFGGIPVFQGVFIAHITRRGELVSISSQFVPSLATAGAAAARNPIITAREAVALGAQNIGEMTQPDDLIVRQAPAEPAGAAPEQPHVFVGRGVKGDAHAKLVWLPLGPAAMRLCWEVILTGATRSEMFRLLADSQTGEIHLRQCLTAYLSDITLRVFTGDSPSPFAPGWPTPNNGQPPTVSRQLVTLAALDTNASPAGWINDGVNETLGNNVDAHTDFLNFNTPDLPRPHGSPNRVFDFPLDLAQSPTNYAQAAVVQLFYWNNWMHDKLYELGFTEAAGNFQTDNFGRGGLGNDAVQADAQDSAALSPASGNRNNANFSTPPDGIPGRLQAYLFNGPNPNRDADLDAQIILHEYTHGLSWRLVGGGQALGDEAQADGMGEGWSDFYPLALLSDASQDVNGTFAAAAYSSYMLAGAGDTQNYYFGLRRYPYSTDLAKNPLTYKDIDSAQADYCNSGAPYHSAMFGTCNPDRAGEVHSVGEAWCSMLWEARANLIQKWGWAIGNQLTLQLVTDGMRLSPPQPNFIDARDAILQADEVNNAGANQGELWAAFAKRGLGFSATSPVHSTRGVQEAFDLPDDLRITPVKPFVSSGPVGGPFDHLVQTFSLTNHGTNTLSWTLSNDTSWLTADRSGGALLPDGPADTVSVSLNAAAVALASNLYNATVFFTNVTSGMTQHRSFLLRVGLPDTFTQLFVGRDNDLAFSSTTFTPNGSFSYYSACHEPASAFPTDPAGGNVLTLDDDSFQQVNLSGATVSLYGSASSTFYVGSNGYLTMNSGDNNMMESFDSHFNRPRISALFHDLNPSAAGSVSWKQLADRVVVTFQGVPEYGTTSPNDFQIEWFFDGRIRLTYLTVSCGNGLVGLSQGQGVPGGFIETDLSEVGFCAPLMVSAPASVTEGDGVLAGVGAVQIPLVLPTNLTVKLSVTDSTDVIVPLTLTIPSGQRSATFDITVVDDTILNGSRRATLNVSAPGVGEASTNMLVYDNESATLTLSLPSTVIEGQGTAPGTVFINAAAGADVSVALTSSNPSSLVVPATVVMAAGQTSVTFDTAIIDNLVVDGSRDVTVTAHVQNWVDGSAAVTVLDNENPVALTDSGLTIVSESCLPANHRADPGETLSVDFSVRNLGIGTASNVTATLLATGGIAAPTAPVSLGDIAPGSTVDGIFSFQVSAACGEPVTATLQVQYGSAVDSLNYTLPVGGTRKPLAENFDELTPPALPAGWTANASGVTPWCTTAASSDTPPNAVFAADQISASDNQLISPAFAISSDTARLTFRHRYDLEPDYDVGRLEISVDNAVFIDWLAAGGTFLAGGYNAGAWWSGNSSGYVTTIAAFPPSAAGHSVQLRWRLTTDGSLGVTGWYVDSIEVTENVRCCFSDDLSLVMSASPGPVNVGSNINYSLGVANSGPHPVGGVFVTNALPQGVSLLAGSASQGSWTQNGQNVVFDLGTLAPGASVALSLTVMVQTEGYLTNVAIVARDGIDPDPSNNTAACVTRALTPAGSNTFAAPLPISIPLLGVAAPYPSTNVVSGVAGPITSVSVTLSNLSHNYPADLAIVLVGPLGQNVILMANAGGGYGLANATLTFDDAASLPIPTNQITAGTYRPAAYSPPALPSPAPLPPYGADLSVFAGTNPNGMWSLYVYDDAPGDSGSISQGWYLTIATASPPPPPKLESRPLASGQVELRFESVAGHTYHVEYLNALGTASWSTLQTITGDGTPKTFTDVVTETRRFYRLRVE